MDKLIRISQALRPAFARMRGGIALRALRHACLAVLVAAPALGACPTVQRGLDATLYDSALDLVQSVIRDDEPWPAGGTAAVGTAAADAALDDRPRPRYLAAQAAAPLGDRMDLLTVAAAHAVHAAMAEGDDGGGRARFRAATLPSYSPPGALFSMVAANDAQASDDGPFPLLPGAPEAFARPHPTAAEPPASNLASERGTPIPAPLVVLPVAEFPSPVSSGEPLVSSAPPVIPPVIGGAPPETIAPESSPSPVLSPPPGEFGTYGSPPVVPPAGGGNAASGDDGAVQPGARPLPEPGTPWLVMLSLALFAATLRRAPVVRAARTG